MSFKRFDPFRYSVDTVSPVVRKDLAGIRVPELGAEQLEPPAELKGRLASLGGKASSPQSAPLPATAALPTPAPETPRTMPSASPPQRRLSKAVMLALGVALASLAAALLRS